MRRLLVRTIVWIICILVLLFGVAPLLIPVGEAEGTRPVRELAGPDAQFFEFRGVSIHYEVAGEGGPPLVLLHGFGASTFSFHAVMSGWSQHRRVLAYDRPAFGLTERPWPLAADAPNPYAPEFSLDLLSAMIDLAGGPPAILVGNSAGGTVAVRYALEHPDRVAALVLISPAIHTSGPPALVRAMWRLPQVSRLGPRLLRWALPRFGQDGIDAAWHDPSRVTEVIRAGYARPLEADHWDHALWSFSQAQTFEPLTARLAELTPPTFIVTGDDDRIVPTAETIRLGEALGSPAFVVPRCGHLAHEECPDAWSDPLEEFLGQLGNDG